MKFRAALLTLFLLVPSAFAQSPPLPESVDLDTVLKLAQEASPRLALERQAITAAEADRLSAGAYPNPTISYGYERPDTGNPLFEGRRQQEVSVEFPLLLGGQRGARIQSSERAIEAARARVAAAGNELAAAAGEAFIGLLVAQKKHGVLLDSMDELKSLRGVVANRQASGMASEYDLLRVDVEQVSWRAQISEAEAELMERRAELAVLLGLPDWQPQAEGELRPLDMGTEPPAVADVPAIVAAHRDEAVARADVEVARRERFPAVSVNTGRIWTDGPFGAVNEVGIAVEIPIFDRRRGQVDRARAEAQAAALQRQLVEVQVATDVHRYAALVTQRRLALEDFQQQVGARLSDLTQMADDAYRFGQSSIIELLDATRSRYEAQLKQLDLLAGLMEAQLRLRAARGELLTSRDY